LAKRGKSCKNFCTVRGISRKKLAERMGTSRGQVSRLLDPKDGNVTVVTLQRAAELLARKVPLELI
jgi:transcriptional regulator with XRE-family HTH domain